MSTLFEKAFADLKKLGEQNLGAKSTYKHLKTLDFDTSGEDSDKLISELKAIRYASNTNSFFYFYFPIVTHILYYKPLYEKEILSYLVGPNFANGTMETKVMIALIQGAMKFKFSENECFLTEESQNWITHELPKMEDEIDREIQLCWKELDE